MGTFAQCFVKCHDIESVAGHLEAHFSIRKKEILDDSIQWWPFNWDEQRGDTMVVSGSLQNWTGVEFDYYSHGMRDYDDWFKQLSADLDTLVLFGYYQSSTGHSRVAAFRNGEMEISAEHNYLQEGKPLELTDNTGLDEELATFLELPATVGADVYGPSIMDHDVIYRFFERLGWHGPSPGGDNVFIHLERMP